MVRGDGVLPAGTHTYEFNIPLPLSCPTSCEGKYGHTRYALWVIIDRPLRFDNEFSRPLTVLRTVDLNLNPVYKVRYMKQGFLYALYWESMVYDICYGENTKTSRQRLKFPGRFVWGISVGYLNVCVCEIYVLHSISAFGSTRTTFSVLTLFSVRPRTYYETIT